MVRLVTYTMSIRLTTFATLFKTCRSKHGRVPGMEALHTRKLRMWDPTSDFHCFDTSPHCFKSLMGRLVKIFWRMTLVLKANAIASSFGVTDCIIIRNQHLHISPLQTWLIRARWQKYKKCSKNQRKLYTVYCTNSPWLNNVCWTAVEDVENSW